MGKPIKFRSKKEFRIVNRCLVCGEIIPDNKILCAKHEKLFGRPRRYLK